MKITSKILFFFLVLWAIEIHAQDPHFTQVNSSPMLVNPAYTGVFDNSQIRFITLHRQQWSDLGTPYTTTYLGLDAKAFESDLYYQNPFNIGMHLISDKTFNGALKDNAATFTTSYHVPLTTEGKQTIGIGLGLGYGTKRIDFTNLTSGAQFTSGGFDQSVPNGEVLQSNSKPYFLISPGIMYTYNNKEDGTFFDIGLAVFNSNQPTLSYTYAGNERIPRRISAQASFQRYFNNTYLFNADMQYQSQAGTDYLLSGVSCARLLQEDIDAPMIGLGLWYRTGDAIAPYLFGEYNKIRFGFTYDFQVNDIRKDALPARSFEFSLRWRIATNASTQ